MSKFAYMRKPICLTIASLCFCCLCILGPACSYERPPERLPYGAVLFDKAERRATEDFLTENRTNSPAEDDDDELPDERILIMDSEEEFDSAFDSFPEEVAFPHDILVVYFFADIYYGFECKLLCPLSAVWSQNYPIAIMRI